MEVTDIPPPWTLWSVIHAIFICLLLNVQGKLSLSLENKDEWSRHGRMQAITNLQERSTSHKMNVLEASVTERSGSGHGPSLSHAAGASVHKCSAGFRGRPGNKFIPQAIRLSGRPEAGKEQEKRGWK